MAAVYSYDLVPYHGTSVPAADCRRIEAIARLFGVTAPSPSCARVLDLGCGDAADLIPQALEHPCARFVGCDMSRSALASAQRAIDGLGLTNVEVRHADLCEVDEGWGSFDYILCRDVFSWVSAAVRQKILDIFVRHLAPHGVAYVTYDVLPGWRLHEISRDMMRYHAAGLSDPRHAIDQARAILAIGAAVQDQKPGAYAELLREAYAGHSAISDEELYHWAFSEHHQPFHSHEFDRLIGEAGLQFLSDADMTRLVGPREPAEARAFLDVLPRAERQQYLDFLTNCAWRGALLCHRDLDVFDRPDASVLRHCWVSMATNARGELDTTEPAIRHALSRVEERRPEFVAFSELCEDVALPAECFLEACAAGRIDVSVSPRTLSRRISDRPTVSPLARLQARHGSTVTNQKCEPVRLSDLARYVVALLDGVRSREDLTESVAREIRTGRFAGDWIGRLRGDDTDAGRPIDDLLHYLRDRALLVA